MAGIEAIAKLDRTLPTVQFESARLGDVIDSLRGVSGANIFVNWKSLEGAGIDRNTPVSASLRNIKFSKALNVILDSVGGGQTRLGYTIDEGVITISTADDLSKNVVVRVYDIRDLLAGRSPSKSGAATSASQPTSRPSRQEVVDSILRLIMDTVDNDLLERTRRKCGGLARTGRPTHRHPDQGEPPADHRPASATASAEGNSSPPQDHFSHRRLRNDRRTGKPTEYPGLASDRDQQFHPAGREAGSMGRCRNDFAAICPVHSGTVDIHPNERQLSLIHRRLLCLTPASWRNPF